MHQKTWPTEMANHATMRNTGYSLKGVEQSDAPGPPPMPLMISITLCGQVIGSDGQKAVVINAPT